MNILITVIALAVFVLCAAALSVRVVKQYELGVLFRFGRFRGIREYPGSRRSGVAGTVHDGTVQRCARRT